MVIMIMMMIMEFFGQWFEGQIILIVLLVGLFIIAMTLVIAWFIYLGLLERCILGSLFVLCCLC